MLTPSDFITLPYTPDLTQAGIAYACRSLPYTYNRMGGTLFDRLRRIVGGKAVELALRRYLAAQKIPYDNLGATPFTDPDRYDIALGGRRCDVKSFLFLRKRQIRRLRHEPAYLLRAAALVPSDQITATHLDDRDLYIFAFVTALLAARQEVRERATAAGQPVYLIHPLPSDWVQRSPWESLGNLALKSDTSLAVHLEMGGQGADRAFQTEQIELAPRRRTAAHKDFYTLAYLHAHQLPDGAVGVHSPALGQTHLVEQADWENIWVYGMEIILVGYMTRGEFRRRARFLPSGSRVIQYASTRTPNFGLPVAHLHPMGDLFSRVRSWGNHQRP